MNNINSIKPPELYSVNIKEQKIGDCWAHAISRNFVRTFQVLCVIKSKYVEQFYILFYTILTGKIINCENDIGNNYIMSFYLLNYLKNNFKEKIFTIKYNYSDCNKYYFKEKLNDKILDIDNEFDKELIIHSFDYLFNNNLLFIAKYTYTVDPAGNNNPSFAIKNMLDYRLQPYATFNMNKYFSEEKNNILYNKDNYDNKCVDDEPSHAVNLRRWTKDSIEFKNSWSKNYHDEGNFKVTDLKYLICNHQNNLKNNINFMSLMFKYDKINNDFYKNLVDNKLQIIHKTFDDSLVLLDEKNFVGELNKYGLYDGYGKIIYDVNSEYEYYEGNFVNGFREGYGVFKYKNGKIYNGEWTCDNRHGKGKEIKQDGSFYEGDWINNKKYGNGMIKYPNGDTYEGEWKNNIIDGVGKFEFENGVVYVGNFENGKYNGYGRYTNNIGEIYIGNWVNNKKSGKGKMTYLDGSIYDGEWANDMKSGKGVYTDKHGDIYIGEWINGNGEAYFKSEEDEILIKKWENDIEINLKNNPIAITNTYKNKYLKYKIKYLNLKK